MWSGMELLAGVLTMLVHKHRPLSLALAVFACVSLVTPMVTRAADTPKIHPKKIELLHGVVTGTRTVPAYAAALAARAGTMGEIYCADSDSAKIKSSTIFRVRTASRYFDLSKLCTNDMAFDDYAFQHSQYTWDHWQRLHVGEAVTLRVVKRTEQLSIPRCEDLGLLSKPQVQLASDLFSSAGRKVYRSHCIYGVTEAYVKVRRPSYYVGHVQRGYHYDLWTFRVVDGGPLSQAKNKRIGAGYSASLPPPW